MAVYVDDAFIEYGRMLMCHMIADSHEELVAMADMIAVPRKWIQNEGTWREHLDVSKVKRNWAIKAGAIPISQRELAVRRRKKGLRIAVRKLATSQLTKATEQP